jgi:hypothetical protein
MRWNRSENSGERRHSTASSAPIDSFGVCLAITRPGLPLRTTTSSPRNIASSMLCVTIIAVILLTPQRYLSSVFNRSRPTKSMAENGSSQKRIEGSLSSARIIETRCRIPPESSPGRLFSKPAKPRDSIMVRILLARLRFSSPFSSKPSAAFWRSVRQGRSNADCGTNATPCFDRMGSSSTVPVVGNVRPARIRSNVVLPHPLGPTIAKKRPRWTSKFISLRTSTRPWSDSKYMPTPRERRSTSLSIASWNNDGG